MVVAGSAGLAYAWPIGLTIAGLLIIVALSYYQTIHAYPSGGGSYIVGRLEPWDIPGLIAAAALLIDYVLNAAVSLTAGVAAMASAFPELWPHRTILALRSCSGDTHKSARSAGDRHVMAVPVYLFLGTYLSMLAYGAVKLWLEGPSR